MHISSDIPFNVSVLQWAAWAVRQRLPHLRLVSVALFSGGPICVFLVHCRCVATPSRSVCWFSELTSQCYMKSKISPPTV